MNFCRAPYRCVVAVPTFPPKARKLVDELFERLQSLENAPRDPDATDAINQGLDKAPHALYPLVQSVLVQDEALKRADARIRELEAELGIDQPQAQPQGGFLDNMRDALLGKPEGGGSVPSVRAGANPNASGNAWGPAYNQGAPMQPQQPQQYGQPQYGQPQYGQPMQQQHGGSFLGTAAATVAGVVGGALLMNSFKGMFGGQQPGQSHSAFDQPTGGARVITVAAILPGRPDWMTSAKAARERLLTMNRRMNAPACLVRRLIPACPVRRTVMS